MYSEEETELRDLIIQNLESCGFLNKIKAELRAGVFLALEEDGNLKNKIPLFNQKLNDFVNTSGGKLMLSLVREFLEYFNLNFTLSVFDPEVSAPTPCVSRAELCDQLKLGSDIDGPIITTLLKEEMEKYNHNPFLKPSDNLKPVINKSVSSILGQTVISEKSTFGDILDKEQSLGDILNKEQSLGDILNKEQSLGDILNKEQLLGDILNKEQSLGDILNKEQSHNFNNLQNDNYDMKDNSEDKTKISSNVLSEVHPKTLDNTETTVSEETLDTRAKSDHVDASKSSDMFKDSKEILSSDHDPFFDEPLPSEKPSFFSFADTLKEKSDIKVISSVKNDLKKSSLSSLKDLPSLTASSEWTFSRDLKNTLPSLDSIKSVSSSEASNEEIINLDTKENFQKKDSDIAESNESSEKQNSDSIEEEIDDDFSAGFDDLLNSSLSLGDDVTTDQTVSQVSVVEGIDHVEPCNS